MTPGARIRFRNAQAPRVLADAYIVVAVDHEAAKVKVRHDRPRGHAYAYLFWYDIGSVEVIDDGAARTDSP